MKELFIILLLANAAKAQNCNIGNASGEIPEHCITDVPPVPSKHFTMPPYAKPISVVGEPTNVSVIKEPTVIEPAPLTKKEKIKTLNRKISTLRSRIRRYQAEVKRLSR